jgi:hypothetical protein
MLQKLTGPTHVSGLCVPLILARGALVFEPAATPPYALAFFR